MIFFENVTKQKIPGRSFMNMGYDHYFFRCRNYSKEIKSGKLERGQTRETCQTQEKYSKGKIVIFYC